LIAVLEERQRGRTERIVQGVMRLQEPDLSYKKLVCRRKKVETKCCALRGSQKFVQFGRVGQLKKTNRSAKCIVSSSSPV
jgi:hypothetical protein